MAQKPRMAQGPPPQVAQGPPHSPRTPTWHRDPHVAQGPPQGTGTPAWPRDPYMAPGPPCGSGTPPLHWLHCSPAFLVVRYIILFFLLPLRLPHKAPAEGTGMLEPGLGTAPQHGDIAGGAGEGVWHRTGCGGHLQVPLHEGFALLLQQLAGDEPRAAPLHVARLGGTEWHMGTPHPWGHPRAAPLGGRTRHGTWGPLGTPLGSEGHGVAHGDPISLETPPSVPLGLRGHSGKNGDHTSLGTPPMLPPLGLRGHRVAHKDPSPQGPSPAPSAPQTSAAPSCWGTPVWGWGTRSSPPVPPPHLTCHQLGSSWLTICSRSPAAKRSPASLQGMRLSEAGS